MRWGALGLLAVTAMAGPARAERFVDPAPRDADPEADAPASVAFGALGDPLVRLAAPRVTAHAEADRVRADVRIQLTTTGLGHREVVIPIVLPHGAVVRAMTIDTGDGHARARAMPADDARDDYQFFIASGVRDPGLLALTGHDARVDHLELRVFPVTRQAAAEVALAIELPPAPQLTIDLGPGAGSRRLTVPAPRLDWMTVPAAAADRVDAETSLFAGPPPSHLAPVPTVTIGQPMCMCGPFGLDKKAVRKVIVLHRPQLAECFIHEAQFGKPDLAGRAVLHFVIAPSGAVASSHIEGPLDDPAVTGCLGREVAGWTFLPGDSRTEVFYPLDFKRLD
jgi:hypothetical protein